MADITLTVDVSSLADARKKLNDFQKATSNLTVNQLASGIKSLQGNIKQLVDAQRDGTIGSNAYNKGLLELKRAYEALGYSSQKATAKVRAYAQQLKDQAAAREAAKAAEEAAAATKRLADRQQELRMRFQQGYAAFSRARSQLRDLREALRSNIITTEQYRAAVKRLREEMNNQNQLNQGNIRSQNALGVAIQQTGYQVGDFFVQIQSGTDVLVAFGQQATQLVGVLPLIHAQLGLSAMAAIGLSTGLGIAIPIITAVGSTVLNLSGGSKTLEDRFTDLSSASGVLHDSLSRLEDTKLSETFGSLSGFVKSTSQAMRDLAAQQELDRLVDTFKEIRQLSDAGIMDNIVQGFKTIATFGVNIKTDEMLDEGKFRELGLNMSRSTFDGFINGLRYHAERGDRTSLVAMFNEMMTEVTKSGVQLPQATFEMLVQLEKAMLAVAESQATLSGENKKVVQTAQEEFEKLQEQKVMMSRASGDERAAIEQELTAQLIKAQDEYIEAIKEAQEAGKGLSELDLKSPFEEALPAARLLAYEMGIALNDALSLINAASSDGGPVGRGRGKSQGAGSTSTERLLLGMGGEFIPGKPDRKKRGGKSEAEQEAERIANFEKQLKLEQELIGKSEARKRVLQALGVEFVNNNQAAVAGYEAQIEAITEAMRLEEERKSLMASVESSLEAGFMSMVDGTKSVKDAFKQMATDIIKELYRVLVVKKLVSTITGFFADGGVFSGGSQIKAFANGGVVGGPTYFPMSGGKTGLMGEAGPEAIMPLKRGANGKLGVEVQGGAGTVVVNNNFTVQANGDESVKRIVQQQIPRIAEATKAAVVDSKRRGGSYGRAFG